MSVRRRRRHQKDDIKTLVGVLGGDAHVPAIYDVRKNVTVVSNAVSAWNDARGAGHGPALTGNGAPKPAWDAVNKIITTDGVQNYLQSASFAGFEVSGALTLIYIGTMPTGNFPMGFSDAGVTKYWAIQASGATYALGVSASSAGAASPVAPSSTRRAMFVSRTVNNPYATTPTGVQTVGKVQGRIGRGFGTMISDGSSELASGNWQFNHGVGGSNHAVLAARALIMLDHPVTGAEWTAITSWAAAYHAAVADNSVSKLIVYDGHSWVSGVQNSAGHDFPSLIMAKATYASGWEYINAGVGSRTGADMALGLPHRIAPAFVGTQVKKFYIAMEGANDAQNGRTPAQAVANLQSCCLQAKSAGATLTVVLTAPPAAVLGALGSAGDTWRVNFNNLLKAGVSGIDLVIDIDLPQFNSPDPSSGTNTYYATDNTHPNDTGAQLVADTVATALVSYS